MRTVTKMMLNSLYGKHTVNDGNDMFVTQVGVSEKRHITVARLVEINECTGKEFPVSGDAKLRMEHQLLKARMETARLLYQDTDSLEAAVLDEMS